MFNFLIYCKKNKSCTMFLFIATVIVFIVHDTEGQTSDYIDKLQSTPEITFVTCKESRTFKLDKFMPAGDSCSDLEMDFQLAFGAVIHFSSTLQHTWKFNGVGNNDSMHQKSPVRVEVVNNQAGDMERATIFLGGIGASDLPSSVKPDLPDNISIKPDSAAPLDFSIRKISYFCGKQPQTVVELYKKFTYPPGYGRREPAYNYPELSMFHCGNSVHIPEPGKVRTRGILINYWHILHPPEFKEMP
jgi:hypothetical protein